MSLTDLKRKNSGKKKPKLSVEEFINDASAYAKGKSVFEQAPSESNSTTASNFKNATFTLTHVQIDKLTELSEQSGISKSRIVRLLIDQQFELDLDDLKKLDNDTA